MLRFGGIGDSRIGWIVIRSVLAEAGMDDATLL
jgi:hypothetical protein